MILKKYNERKVTENIDNIFYFVYKIIQSMSRKGNFFGRLKEEIWYNKEYKYENSKDLIKEIHSYIKYYNETRIVTRLKTNPINFRNKCLNELWVR